MIRNLLRGEAELGGCPGIVHGVELRKIIVWH
jgi:hypothetical protein